MVGGSARRRPGGESGRRMIPNEWRPRVRSDETKTEGWCARLGRTVSVLSLLVSGGCATAGTERAVVAQLERGLSSASCGRSLDDAWDEARRLLDEQGYELAGADARAVGKAPGPGSFIGPFGSLLSAARETRVEGTARMLETGWRSGQRYRLEGSAEAPGCHVVFLTLAEDPGQRGRDVWQAPRPDRTLELELLRRLAPEEATRLEGPTRP